MSKIIAVRIAVFAVVVVIAAIVAVAIGMPVNRAVLLAVGMFAIVVIATIWPRA